MAEVLYEVESDEFLGHLVVVIPCSSSQSIIIFTLWQGVLSWWRWVLCLLFCHLRRY